MRFIQSGIDKSEKRKREFTSLELINDGNGVATDIRIVRSEANGNNVPLRNITAMGKPGNTQVRYFGEQDAYNNINRDIDIKISIEYKDISDRKYKAEFVSDKQYNDGFRIESQRELKSKKE